LIATIALTAVIGASMVSVEATAATQCKSTALSGIASSDSLAIQSWQSHVKDKYGAVWSNFGIAKNKRYTSQSLIFSSIISVTANPCRKTT
jgi:hypothetical protein